MAVGMWVIIYCHLIVFRFSFISVIAWIKGAEVVSLLQWIRCIYGSAPIIETFLIIVDVMCFAG